MTRRLEPDNDVMRAAMESALRRRIANASGGVVTLPTGIADVAEIDQVLGALDRARAANGIEFVWLAITAREIGGPYPTRRPF